MINAHKGMMIERMWITKEEKEMIEELKKVVKNGHIEGDISNKIIDFFENLIERGDLE
jgi:hypothetical protein